MVLQTQNPAPVVVTNDEIDLIAVFQIIWRGKWQVLSITFLAAIIAVVYAIMQPNIYQSKALLAPAANNSQPQASQFQGLAAMAGINVGGAGIDKIDIALETLKSHRFILNFIANREILVPLMAIKSWDKETNTIIYDDAIYDKKLNKWTSKNGTKPSYARVYDKFKSVLNIAKDPITNFVTLSIDFPVPALAQKWVSWLVSDINQYSRDKEIKNSKNSIEYLQNQLGNTHIADIRLVFFELIKKETQNMLLAATREEYIFETIDPSILPEKRTSPKRALIAILGTLLGGLLGLIFVFGRHIYAGINKE